MMLATTRQYNHLEAGHPRNPKPFAICGANKRQPPNEVYNSLICTHKAGWGTSHPGVGRCKLHGGSSLVGSQAPGYKDGTYSKYLPGQLAHIYNQVSDSHKDNPLVVWEELNLQRTMLLFYVSRLSGDDIAFDNGNYHKQESSIVDGSSLVVSGEKVGVGGVVVNGGSKVSSSLAGIPGVSPSSVLLADVTQSEIDDIIRRKESKQRTTVDERAKLRAWKQREKQQKRKLGGGLLAIDEEELQVIETMINNIVGNVQKITAMINNDRLTTAEIVFMFGALREVINEFIPDPENQRKFVERLKEKLPVLQARAREGE